MADDKAPLGYNIADFSNRKITPIKKPPPPLPPRENSASQQIPPPYSEWSDDKKHSVISEQWRSRDPRSSSVHSLLPTESVRDGKRRLLLVYVHGFVGNETSFQSFPAHVHNLLSISLSESHAVHTKIYPRYKSRRAIEYAVEDFSNWLQPHEDEDTDVILLGHSMGGILIADVVLLPPRESYDTPYRHRILGTINFDTPFLGMHPGLIMSGISSLFRAAPQPVGETSRRNSLSPSASGTEASQSTVSLSTEPWMNSGPTTNLSPTQSAISSTPSDPNYNAPFPNDVRIQERKGWSNVLHFINKHSGGLTDATKQYVMSHIEFGGCLADFAGLKSRYSRIRALEDVHETVAGGRQITRRVRFINYYTASTGIPKKPKEKDVKVAEQDMPSKDDLTQGIESQSRPSLSRSSASTHSMYEDALDNLSGSQESITAAVQIQIDNMGESSGIQEAEILDDDLSILPMQHVDSMPIPDSDDEGTLIPSPAHAVTASSSGETNTANISQEVQATDFSSNLPPLPSKPQTPPPLDLSPYGIDKEAYRLAEKTHKATLKTYQKAVKDRETALKDRRRLLEKREKAAQQAREKEQRAFEKRNQKEAEKARKEAEKARMKADKERLNVEEANRVEKEIAALTVNPPQPTTSHTQNAGDVTADARTGGPQKPKKDRKFCLLPSDLSGPRDTCWIRVHMEGVDEVGAHCGLFFPGPQYESLVGDVGKRIETWVRGD